MRRQTIAVVLLLIAVLALGMYVVQLVRHARQIPAPAADNRPIAPPTAGTMTPVILFVANDDDGTLRRRDVTVALPADREKRARDILRALVTQYQERTSTHALGPGADVNEVYLVDDNLAVVDTNAVFADGHRSGILVEELTLASMAQTLAANLPGITRMKVLVDGKERATLAGHAGLAQAYNVGAAAPLVR